MIKTRNQCEKFEKEEREKRNKEIKEKEEKIREELIGTKVNGLCLKCKVEERSYVQKTNRSEDRFCKTCLPSYSSNDEQVTLIQSALEDCFICPECDVIFDNDDNVTTYWREDCMCEKCYEGIYQEKSTQELQIFKNGITEEDKLDYADDIITTLTAFNKLNKLVREDGRNNTFGEEVERLLTIEMIKIKSLIHQQIENADVDIESRRGGYAVLMPKQHFIKHPEEIKTIWEHKDYFTSDDTEYLPFDEYEHLTEDEKDERDDIIKSKTKSRSGLASTQLTEVKRVKKRKIKRDKIPQFAS